MATPDNVGKSTQDLWPLGRSWQDAICSRCGQRITWMIATRTDRHEMGVRSELAAAHVVLRLGEDQGAGGRVLVVPGGYPVIVRAVAAVIVEREPLRAHQFRSVAEADSLPRLMLLAVAPGQDRVVAVENAFRQVRDAVGAAG